MIDRAPPPTRSQVVVAFVNDLIVYILAFAVGAGGYFAAVTTAPLRMQDYAGAIAAGAAAVLMRMFPTSSGGQRG
jgi:hypothetical protein